MMVLFYHMKDGVGDTLITRALFGSCGRYCVAVFFFMSGYGLMLQLKKSGVSMFANYASRRFPKLLVPYFTAWILVAWAILPKTIDLTGIGTNWLTGESFLPYSYYIEELFLFYILFWAIFRFFNIRWGLLLLFVSTIAIMLCFRHIQWNNHWWISSIAFPMGSLLAYAHPHKKNIWLIGAGILCSSAILFFGKTLGWIDFVVFHAFAVEPVFCYLLFLIIPLLQIRPGKFNCLKFIGNISYEFYILSGAVLYLCKNLDFPAYTFAVLSALICVAFIFNKVNRLIVKLIQNLFKLSGHSVSPQEKSS